MKTPTTAEELLPLIASLNPEERVRLIRLIVQAPSDDAAAYATAPSKPEEFGSDYDPLEWEADGWEDCD